MAGDEGNGRAIELKMLNYDERRGEKPKWRRYPERKLEALTALDDELYSTSDTKKKRPNCQQQQSENVKLVENPVKLGKEKKKKTAAHCDRMKPGETDKKERRPFKGLSKTR